MISLIPFLFLICCKKEELKPHIADSNFLHTLLELGIDSNADSVIGFNEAELVDSLYIREKNISDISGIEAFVNPIYLDCERNRISSMDFSKNI